ncbi:MAG TPA: M48 family metallopeptidase [Telluria sp.]|nr:M48 family metallopeptidase [Telluria sp.]
MKYEPSLPQHNDNVSDEHPLKDFVVILGVVAAISALVFWLLGLAVDVMVDRMSAETEARLYSMMPAPQDADKDEALPEARLQAMIDGMRSCAGLRLPARVMLAKSKTPNAAVMPGGQIVVFSGLVDHVKSDNGLSFVLAHELAHITNRDHLRAMGRGIVLFGISALLTGSDSGLSELLAPVHHLGAAKYSRSREEAADAAALRTLNCRYGHVGGATEFFEDMKDEDAAEDSLSHYVASHPAMGARIETLNAAARSAGYKTGAVAPLSIPPLN